MNEIRDLTDYKLFTDYFDSFETIMRKYFINNLTYYVLKGKLSNNILNDLTTNLWYHPITF